MKFLFRYIGVNFSFFRLNYRNLQIFHIANKVIRKDMEFCNKTIYDFFSKFNGV